MFGGDVPLNISFQVDWECVKEHKQNLILQNNKRKNAARKPYTYGDDKAMILQDPNRKHGEPLFKGPHTVTKKKASNDNGTIQLTKAADNGRAVTQTWNIWNLEPLAA